MRFLLSFFCILCLSLEFQSCGDNLDIEEVTSHVEYIIKSDTPDAQIRIEGTGLPVEGVYFKGEFKSDCTTKDYFAVIDVTCSDPKALIDVTMILDHKKKLSCKRNRSVFISERLKGKGSLLK